MIPSDNILHANNSNLVMHCETSNNNYARKVIAGSLLTLAWFIFAPLMYPINRKMPLLCKKQSSIPCSPLISIVVIPLTLLVVYLLSIYVSSLQIALSVL
ncbi:MAG: hypothetical protein K2O49_06250 [Muribaculaceae bacterium]|nr:hypothetical protein [Muribaculaceae bacterium]